MWSLAKSDHLIRCQVRPKARLEISLLFTYISARDNISNQPTDTTNIKETNRKIIPPIRSCFEVQKSPRKITTEPRQSIHTAGRKRHLYLYVISPITKADSAYLLRACRLRRRCG